MGLPPSQSDIILHALSLQIAAAYHTLVSNSYDYEGRSYDENLPDDIITAYRCIRRHISKGTDGKAYGAEHASKMFQGQIQ